MGDAVRTAKVAAYESEKTQRRGRGAKSYFFGAEFDAHDYDKAKAKELGAEVAGQVAAQQRSDREDAPAAFRRSSNDPRKPVRG